jgi:cytochrome P450
VIHKPELLRMMRTLSNIHVIQIIVVVYEGKSKQRGVNSMDVSAIAETRCPFTGRSAPSESVKVPAFESGESFGPAAGARTLPVADWVDVAQLRIDPYPTYARLRAESPVVWVPSIKKVLVASFSGCLLGEQHPEIFSNDVSGAHMTRAFGGQPMIRKDGAAHAAERDVINPTLRPKKIAQVWAERFRANTRTYLDDLEAAGPGSDLNEIFAAPLAAKNLIDLLGLTGVAPTDLARWSADFIAGAGNVLDNEDVWIRCQRSRAEVDATLDEALSRLQEHPEDSITSLLLHSGMPLESVRANVILAISGGVNEPQHITTSSVSLLTQHPEHLAWARADPGNFAHIFQETVRFQSPIGMVTRETKTSTEIDGFKIPAHSQIGLLVASANRDATKFEDPDHFNPRRPERRHLAFGSGNHMCAGKWAAETAIGHIAVPALYERFPGLTTDPDHPGTGDGWAFRGFKSLPVIW